MANNPVMSGERPVLAVDVGNSTTNFGLFAPEGSATDEPLGSIEVTTAKGLTCDEARMQLVSVLQTLARGACGELAQAARMGSILACVVPTLTEVWRHALELECNQRPFVVGPGMKTGVGMRYRDPAEIGPDRIADIVAVRESHGSPVVAVDFGTTMNIEVIDAAGTFLGGIIAPGLALGAEAISRAAARLPVIELHAPHRVIGRSTREAMQSGVVLGEVARVDGLIDRVFEELGEKAPIVLAGEHAAELAALLEHDTIVDETLTLRGLHQLYLQNEGAPTSR